MRVIGFFSCEELQDVARIRQDCWVNSPKVFTALFAALAVASLGSSVVHAYPADAPKVPAWAYPQGVHDEPGPDDGKLYHLPGTTQAFTDTQINRVNATIDWFPKSHPAPPSPVITGTERYKACGTCHLMNGAGKPETGDLQGLPVAYFLQQLDDMKNDRRHPAYTPSSLTGMIAIAKALTPEEARQAAEYFHSVPAVTHVRVVESAMAPVTHPGPHTIQLPDPSGAQAPIGDRIVEVSENVDRTKLRDPSTGFVAYVPVGSIARGEALVKSGGASKMACTMCHGADLKGMGDTFPSLAGHSPTATARQLFDFRSGTRDGKNAAAMKPVVAGLSDADIADVAAYLASLKP